jgi:AcrR family transcriptional regulator
MTHRSIEAAVGRQGGRRALAASATRDEVVRAAAGLFRERGYAGTTIEEVADRAGVAVQTIYNAVGGKTVLLEAVLDTVAAGPDAPRLVPEVMAERTRAVESGDEAATLMADWFADVNPRSAWLMRVIRDAAAIDFSIAALEERRAAQRFANYRMGAEILAERVGLRDDTTPEQLAATIWSCANPETYHLLTGARGWSLDAYRAWVHRAVRRHLA